MNNQLVPFGMNKMSEVRTENDLPPHITFNQFNQVYEQIKGLDQIMWGLLWETGGRITAVLSIKWKDIDFSIKELKLLVQKKKTYLTIQIPLSNAVLNDLKNYQLYVKPNAEDFLFDTKLYNREESSVGRLTRQGAWKKVDNWGKKHLGFRIHPHMLRHGLAIYLLSQNVPIAAIGRRLGHSNIFITSNSYLVITSNVDRQLTEHIPMRK